MRFFSFFTFLPLVVGLLLARPAHAQDKPVSEDFNVNIPKTIVILRSTRSYPEALATAKKAANALGRPFQLDGNHPHQTHGLSPSPADCEANAYDYPCYTARGHGGAQDSDYLSVEYSDGYTGLAKGYYIVVAALVEPNSPALKATLTRIRRAYPAAYAKRTALWRGCMH